MNDKHIKVLLVEDEARDAGLVQDKPAHAKPVRELLAQARDASFDLECTDPQLGLERLAHGRVDAVLLDTSLSEDEGHVTFTRLHTQAPDVPIIILTSEEDETLAKKVAQENEQGYLVKEHVNGDILVRSVRNAIERHQLVMALKQQIREEFQANEARFRNIIENDADGIVIVNKDGTIRFINPAAEALFGRRAKELVGELFGFPVVADKTTEINIIHRGLEPAVAEMRVVKTKWEGKVAYLASLHDITNHKRLLAELEQTRRQQLEMKGQFLSRVSHELRSPLTAIHQFVTILLDGLAGDVRPEQREYLEIVLSNVNQLRTMVGDLLEVSHAETGRLVISPRDISLAELITEIVKAFQLTNIKGPSLSADISSDLPRVCADPGRVREIMTTLLNNAIKFTPENGAVSVRAEVYNEDPNFVCVAVSDTGCAISRNESERIFEYLYQGEKNDGASRKGLGLDLYICKELVNRHGGQIWVQSELGHGSTFFFTLPVFSVEQLLGPILTETNLQIGATAIITVEIFPDEKRGLTKDDEAALQDVWNVINGCILPGKDLLLRMTPYTGVGRAFCILVHADRSGAEALVRRIRERLKCSETLQSSGLQLRISVSIPKIPLMENKEPTEETVKKLASQIEEQMKATDMNGGSDDRRKDPRSGR
jgi:PAS domain S-box-containing protein